MAVKRTTVNKTQDPALGIEKMDSNQKPFSKINFLLMGGCLVLIVLGYLFMSGGGSENGEFNPDVFSTRRIVVGPLLSFLGFLLMAFAIIYDPDKKRDFLKSIKKKEEPAGEETEVK